MASGLQALSDFCIRLGRSNGETCVRMPGGAALCAHYGLETGDAGTIIRGFLGDVNTGLAPLVPFFRALDVIKAITDCIQAIPDSIATLSPVPIVKCLEKLIPKLQKLLELIPQLSVPILIADILDLIILGLMSTRAEAATFLAQQERIVAAGLRAAATGNEQLLAVVECETGNLDAAWSNTRASFAPLNRMVDLVNLLLGLAALPKVPSLDDLDELNDEALHNIDALIHGLQTARAALPV